MFFILEQILKGCERNTDEREKEIKVWKKKNTGRKAIWNGNTTEVI
jgi:hypothetical protein